MSITAIIVAGGVGKRFGSDKPKQFLEIANKPIIIHTLEKFQAAEKIENIIIAVHTDWYNHTKELLTKYDGAKVSELIIGGRTRQDSVAAALRTETATNSEIILVHDAVRPFVSPALINQVAEMTDDYGAVVPTVAVKDTIKEIRNGGIKTLDRSKIFAAQTPQGFWTSSLEDAMKQAIAANFEATDDASVLEFVGFKIKNIEGEETNIKITTPLDMQYANLILQ